MLAEPNENAPPWYHTMTGRLAPSRSPGVHTFKVRQSSLSGTVSRGPDRLASSGRCLRLDGACGACPAQLTASRTAGQGSGVCGGMKRRRPPVGAPYGTPLKALMPLAAVPRILPEVVSATGGPEARPEAPRIPATVTMTAPIA